MGCKWLFRIKRNSDASIVRWKARLVAKVFKRTPDLAFKETFSPEHQTIKVVLIIELFGSWSIYQMGVNNVFLPGNLFEDVYMQQPPGFVHPKFPQQICKLKKAIYGLR